MTPSSRKKRRKVVTYGDMTYDSANDQIFRSTPVSVYGTVDEFCERLKKLAEKYEDATVDLEHKSDYGDCSTKFQLLGWADIHPQERAQLEKVKKREAEEATRFAEISRQRDLREYERLKKVFGDDD